MISILDEMRKQDRSQDGKVTIEGLASTKFDLYSGVINSAVDGAVAALEIVAGRVERQFMEAKVEGRRAQVLTPLKLGMIARDLIEVGETLFYMETKGGRLRLLPIERYWSVYGGPDPSEWVIEGNIVGPNKTQYLTLPRSAFLHIINSPSPNFPWRGVSALSRSKITWELARAAEDALARESMIPAKAMVPLPNEDGKGQSIANELRKVFNRRMETMLFPNTTQGRPGTGQPQTDWKPQRVTPMPGPGMNEVAREAQARVIAALGGHPALAGGGSQAADREARRQLMDLLVLPLGALVQHAASEAFGEEVKITWEVQDDVKLTRARTFQTLVAAEIPTEQAMEISGLQG